MSTLKTNTVESTTPGGDCIVKATNNLSNRNLIDNGAFLIAQKGTSATTSAIATVDRFRSEYSGTDEAVTQTQHTLTSSDTGPWEKGFRKSFHMTNGNQSSGAGVTDYWGINHRIEAQDLATCGWNYTSASSYVTLSFWVKASVAQTYQLTLAVTDGTDMGYTSEFALSADTWTKVTKTIPGHANLQFDNDNGLGMEIYWWGFIGTDYTSSSPTGLDTWATEGNTLKKDMTSTWWTTNDATYEITGVQLEVGDVATDFEHRSYGDELARCMRYFQRDGGGQYTGYGMGVITSNAGGIWTMPLPVPMRAAPTITNDGNVRLYDGSTNANVTAWNTNRSTVKNFWIEPQTASSSFTVGRAFLVGNNDTTDGYLNLSAEL